MAKGKKTVEIPPERLAEIVRDARAGTNWAAEHGYGPACRCGLRGATDDQTCYRHPDGVREGLDTSP